jgi:hypothetical protein
MFKTIILGFAAGFLATLIFHQGTAFLLYHYGNEVPAVVSFLGRTNPAYNFTTLVPPFGVPLVLSQAFWGGVWGIVLAAILRGTGVPDILFSVIFGAFVLTGVAITLVPYLKGLPVWNGSTIPWRGLIYNGAWGFGTAFILRPLALRG